MGTPQKRPTSSMQQQLPTSLMQDAWSRYVLLRPGMTLDELRAATLKPDGRAPGTNRTIFFSSFLVILAAIPYIVTNDAVLYRIIELGALSAAGVTPAEMLAKTGSLW